MVIDDIELRNNLTEKGLNNAKKYTWENSVKQFFRIINEVIKNV
jgi:hypothetical protein